MARATGKSTKKKTTKKRGKRRPATRAKTKRPSRGQRAPDGELPPDWSEEERGVPITRIIYDTEGGVFDNPLMYALSPLGETGPARAKFLPELLALQLKAVQYFAINAEPVLNAVPSREALRLFFANYWCSDGSRLKPHMVNALTTACLSLRLGKGGRPRKKPRPSPLDELREGRARTESAEMMRIVLRPPFDAAPFSRPGWIDDQMGPADAPPDPENR